MKRQIRRNVFETNSSSTHSLSISTNRKKIEYQDIPRDSTVVLDDSFNTGTEIFDEMGKLNFVVTMLASIIEATEYEDDPIKIETFEEMIALSWFRWLAEVVKEESNTEVVYDCPVQWNGTHVKYAPYYDTTYDEYESVEEIFTDGDEWVLKDRDKFKARVKDIIYNKNVIIESKENEY